MNQRSIGIEHDATTEHVASEETYKTSAELIADICRRYAIPLDREHIIKHSEVKATQCPGTLDIDRLIRMATEVLAPPQGDTVPVERTKLADFERVKDGWNQVRTLLDVEDSVAVVVAEVKKLISYEDKVIIAERDKAELTAQVDQLKGELEKRDATIQEVKDQAVVLTEEMEKLQKSIQSLTSENMKAKAKIQELTDQLTEGLSGWDLIVQGIGRLFGRK